MQSTGVTTETADKEYVDVAPITYHIDTDRHKCVKLLHLTNDWITKNAKMDAAYKVMSDQSNDQTAATPQEVLTCVEDAEQACKIMGEMVFEPRSKGKRRPLVNRAIGQGLGKRAALKAMRRNMKEVKKKVTYGETLTIADIERAIRIHERAEQFGWSTVDIDIVLDPLERKEEWMRYENTAEKYRQQDRQEGKRQSEADEKGKQKGAKA